MVEAAGERVRDPELPRGGGGVGERRAASAARASRPWRQAGRTARRPGARGLRMRVRRDRLYASGRHRWPRAACAATAPQAPAAGPGVESGASRGHAPENAAAPGQKPGRRPCCSPGRPATSGQAWAPLPAPRGRRPRSGRRLCSGRPAQTSTGRATRQAPDASGEEPGLKQRVRPVVPELRHRRWEGFGGRGREAPGVFSECCARPSHL